MTSNTGGCCSKKVFIVCLALAGVVLLVLGLVFSVGGVFAKLVKDNVNEVSH